jgi:glycosyltransferase involved in cell wall biosynthesis
MDQPEPSNEKARAGEWPRSVCVFSLNVQDPCSCLRVTGPLEHLGVEVLAGNEGDTLFLDRISQADVVLIQRIFPRKTVAYNTVVQRARTEGKPVVFDLDDYLFDLPDEHPEKPEHIYTSALLPMAQAILEADLVTVSTGTMRQALLALNPATVVLPNYFNERIWRLRPPVSRANLNEPVVIGYMGSTSHRPDLETLTPVLADLLAEYGDRIRLQFWGIEPPEGLAGYPNVTWRAATTYLYEDFAADFQQQHADIFIAPLADNFFNRCKSGIKFLEYTALGAPGVYSNLPPYAEMVKHDVTGLLAATPEEWKASLIRLIDDPGLREQMTRQAQASVRENWLLADHAHRWASAYRQAANQAANRPPVLHQALWDLLGPIATQQSGLADMNERIANDRKRLQAVLKQRENEVEFLNQQSQAYLRELQRLSDQWNLVQQSRFGRVFLKTQRIAGRVFPAGSLQARVAEAGLKVLVAPVRLIRRTSRQPRELELIRQSGLFDAQWYLENNPDVAQTKGDPLVHYYTQGAAQGRAPGPNFSSAWYLAQNPDVKASGTNPLVHYLRFGLQEGRKPLPEDGTGEVKVRRAAHWGDEKTGPLPAASRNVVRRQKPLRRSRMMHVGVLAQKAWLLLKKEGPVMLARKVQFKLNQRRQAEILKSDPTQGQAPTNLPVFAPRRIYADSLAERLHERMLGSTYILALSHDDYPRNVGGVQIRLSDEQETCNRKGISYLHLYPFAYSPTLVYGDAPFIVGVNLDGESIGTAEGEDVITALSLLEGKTLTRVDIHHTMGFNMGFVHRLLKEAYPARVRFWANDFFSICPNFPLLRNNVEYCNAPPLHSNSCSICRYGPSRRLHLPEYQRLFHENEVELAAPSEFALGFWREKLNLPVVSGEVIPHARIEWSGQAPPRPEGRPLRVAHVGSPVEHKGWPTFLQLTEEFKSDPRYEFYLFSMIPVEPGNFKRIDIAVTREDRFKMAQALKDHEIDVAVLWSLAPETFSNTMHEALAAGSLILTNPLSGNIQHTLRQHPEWGRVLESEGELLDLFAGRELERLVNDYQRAGKPQGDLIMLTEER